MHFDNEKKYPETMYNAICCVCGVSILPNCLNMCALCKITSIDIMQGVQTTYTVENCRKCTRFFLPPKKWIIIENETDMLAYLIVRHKKLKDINITSSAFVKTEVHSKKIVLELEIEKEGKTCTIQIEFKIRNKQCPECDKMEAKQFWTSVVQIRQRSKSKRTFFYLEQSILKYEMYKDCTNIKERRDGIDFYYLDKNNAIRMVKFLESRMGTKLLVSNKLLTEDRNNNKIKYKFSYSMEIFPLCKDDLIILDESLAKQLCISRLVLVLKINKKITLIDPIHGNTANITNKQFWTNKNHFNILMTSKDLVLFKVDEIEHEYTCMNKQKNKQSKHGGTTVDCFVKRGGNDTFHCKSHLGNILREYDDVYGYDLGNSNLQSIDRNLFKVILVRKKYNNLNISIKTDKEHDREYMFFLEDILEDNDLRKDIDIYDKTNKLINDVEKLNL